MTSLQFFPQFILPPLVSPASDFILMSAQSPLQSELEAITEKPHELNSTPQEDKESQSELEDKRLEGKWKKEEHEKFLEGTQLKQT